MGASEHAECRSGRQLDLQTSDQTPISWKVAPAGLTNFAVCALSTLVASYFLMGLHAASLLLVAAAALGIAWLTRFWPEALGVAAGLAACALLVGAELGAAGQLLGAAGVGGVTAFVWRRRAGGADSTKTPPRLVLVTLIGALTVLLVDAFLLLAFGFVCQSDTGHATPGSDRAAWCGTLGWAWLPVLVAPTALVVLIGSYKAFRGEARAVLLTVVAGLVLAIAVHVPDFVLSNAAP